MTTPKPHSSIPANAPDRPAHRAAYVATTARTPFIADAWDLGYLPGYREDGSFQQAGLPVTDVPCLFLDNNFHNPDPERFLERARDLQPPVAVVGDAYDAADADRLTDHARTLAGEVPRCTPVVVPKSRAALDAIPNDVVVGYPVGYSETTAQDFSVPSDWAGRRVHILGGSPPRQWTAIQRLTGRTVGLDAFGAGVAGGRTTNPRDDPAQVVGLDSNTVLKPAWKGEFWHRESPHWRPAERNTIRGTIRRSLEQVRAFWREREVWPASTPVDDPALGPARDPDPDPSLAVHTCAGCGERIQGARIHDVREYEDGEVWAYCSASCLDRTEYRAGRTPTDPQACDAMHYQHAILTGEAAERARSTGDGRLDHSAGDADGVTTLSAFTD